MDATQLKVEDPIEDIDTALSDVDSDFGEMSDGSGDDNSVDAGDIESYNEVDEEDIDDDVDLEGVISLQQDNDIDGYDIGNDDDDDCDFNEMSYTKLEDVDNKGFIEKYHSSIFQHNEDEVNAMAVVVRDDDGVIVDPLHRTIPILTKYEKARIIGQRASQINNGAEPQIDAKAINTYDGYLIALEELKQKKLPFIIKRPMPFGGQEYWRVKDLEYLNHD